VSTSETTSLITRRRLAAITATGGSALFLAACGVDADPYESASDTTLLGYIRELQSSLADGYDSASRDLPKDLASAFADQAKATLAEIDKALSELGSKTPPQGTFSAALDVGSVGDYEPFLIGVANAVVPDLSTQELRQIAYKAAAAAAARMALVASDAGKEPAPEAFVLGDTPPGFDTDPS
jgi:hypothetical protein